ncbi:MAG: alpha/beta hydrolase [Candidatus Thiodiazotropha sp. DIVDIV]
MNLMRNVQFVLLALFLILIGNPLYAATESTNIRYGYEKVGELDIFYREAGDPAKPVLVLLHGFPTSSHMYREVLQGLSDSYYLIAPDYPGFGNSSFPSPDTFAYTFDHLAEIMGQFLEQRGLKRYSLMIQDYGAPIGFRIARAHPERVQSIITQNGNAYEEGISPAGWGPVLDYWKGKTPELEKTIIDNVFSYEALKWEYTHGTRNPESILPDNWDLDHVKMSRSGQYRMHLDLFYDYQNNLKLYPLWQRYLRDHQPPVLVVWGKHDAFFPEPGAEGYKRDVKDIDYNILDTGHFALEEEHAFINSKIREFLGKRNIK